MKIRIGKRSGSNEKNTDLCKPLLMASMALPVLKQKHKKNNVRREILRDRAKVGG